MISDYDSQSATSRVEKSVLPAVRNQRRKSFDMVLWCLGPLRQAWSCLIILSKLINLPSLSAGSHRSSIWYISSDQRFHSGLAQSFCRPDIWHDSRGHRQRSVQERRFQQQWACRGGDSGWEQQQRPLEAIKALDCWVHICEAYI